MVATCRKVRPAAGTLKVHVEAVLPLAEAAEAHRRLPRGKLLLRAAE